jgi:hypothetical protein
MRELKRLHNKWCPMAPIRKIFNKIEENYGVEILIQDPNTKTILIDV